MERRLSSRSAGRGAVKARMVNAFSDGVPAYEFLVFLTLTSMFAVALQSPVVSRWAAGAQKALAEFVRNRQALPEQDLFADLRVLEAVRIAAGSMAAFRYGEIVWTSLLYGSSVPFAAAVAAGLALLVAVGLFTPIATVALMASANILVDNALGASTLGTQVLSMILLIIFLAPAGRTLSLDAILARTKRSGRVIHAMHRWTGPPSSDRLLVVKILALFAYYCVCLYSAFWHLRDPAWTSGLVIAWVLLSPAHNLTLSDVVVRLYEWSSLRAGDFLARGHGRHVGLVSTGPSGPFPRSGDTRLCHVLGLGLFPHQRLRAQAWPSGQVRAAVVVCVVCDRKAFSVARLRC